MRSPHDAEIYMKKLQQAEKSAYQNLARYKFFNAGYWCMVWTDINRFSDLRLSTPFTDVVGIARNPPRPPASKQTPLGHEYIAAELDRLTSAAWAALAAENFQSFGHHAALWVHHNDLSKLRRRNPWSPLVMLARQRQAIRNGPSPLELTQ